MSTERGAKGRFPKGNPGAGPPTGEGWGGPKKGPGNGTPRKTDAGPGRGHYSIGGEGRLERQARHAEEMRQLYYEFATSSDKTPEIRMKAATHLLDRVEGLPVQKVVTASTDPISMMPDIQLDAEMERQRALIEQFEEISGAKTDGPPSGIPKS